MFAQPLTSQQQAATQQHQAHVSHGPSDQLSLEDVQTSDAAHAFPQQHRMRNSAPGDEQSMFTEPLTHYAPRSGFTRSQAQAAQGHSSPSGGSIPDQQEFASQHQVSNQGPHGEQAYAQPLASDQHEDRQEEQSESAQQELSITAHDSAPQHAMSGSLAPGEQHLHEQPLQSDQQRDEHSSTAASDSHHQSSSDEGPADTARHQAQPLASGQQHLQAADFSLWEAAPTAAAPVSDESRSLPHHSVGTEAPAHEGRQVSRPGYAGPLASDRLQDTANTSLADRDSSAGGQQGFPSQHSVHNAAPAESSMYDQPLTSSEQQPQSSDHARGSPRSSEHGTESPQSSEHGRSHSGDQSPLDDLTLAPEPSPGRETSAVHQQLPVHAPSRQDRLGSQQPHGGEGEGVARRQPDGEDEGQYSSAAQQATSQQPQEQPHEQPHQILTGGGLVTRLLHVAMLRNKCCAETLTAA